MQKKPVKDSSLQGRNFFTEAIVVILNNLHRLPLRHVKTNLFVLFTEMLRKKRAKNYG
jgi:hypothetical protein